MTILDKERLIVHDVNLKNPNTYNRLSQMAYIYTEFCYLQNTAPGMGAAGVKYKQITYLMYISISFMMWYISHQEVRPKTYLCGLGFRGRQNNYT